MKFKAQVPILLTQNNPAHPPRNTHIQRPLATPAARTLNINIKMAEPSSFSAAIMNDFGHSIHHYNPNAICPKCQNQLHFKNRSTICCRCHVFYHKYCVRSTTNGSFLADDKKWDSAYNQHYFFVCPKCTNFLKNKNHIRI